MDQKKLIIFVNDSKNFLISMDENHRYHSMDVYKLICNFKAMGYNVILLKFSEFDPCKNYKNIYVLYHITEDTFTLYKSYIEDIINFLEQKGAILLPCSQYARAHHNKVYMELMKTRFACKELKTIKTHFYGNAYEAINAQHKIKFPVVIKIADGAGSRGVALAENRSEYVHKVCQICRGCYVSSYKQWVKNIIKKISTSFRIKKFDVPRYYGKMIVQTFIPDLSGDYKVLYFGKKYFILKRLNRDYDFRASGSGKLFNVPDDEARGLLDFAKKVVQEIDFSIIGMDIGYDGATYHLLEFQMIHLGPYALSMSEYYYIEKDGRWIKVPGKSDLEEEFCRSIDSFIREKGNESE